MKRPFQPHAKFRQKKFMSDYIFSTKAFQQHWMCRREKLLSDYIFARAVSR